MSASTGKLGNDEESLQSDATITEGGIRIPYNVQAVLKPDELIPEPRLKSVSQLTGIMKSSPKEYPESNGDSDSDNSFMRRKKLIEKLGIAQAPGRIRPRILNLRDSLTRLENSSIKRNSLLVIRTKQDDPMDLLNLSSPVQNPTIINNTPAPNVSETSPKVLPEKNNVATSPTVLPSQNDAETSPNISSRLIENQRLIDEETSPNLPTREWAGSLLASSEEWSAAKQPSPQAILTSAKAQTQLPTLEMDLENDKSPENMLQQNSLYNLVMDDTELGEDELKASNQELLVEYKNCGYLQGRDMLHLQEIQIYDIKCPPKGMPRQRNCRYLDLAGISASDRNEKLVWVVGETIYAKMDPCRDTWKSRKFHKALSKAMQIVQMRRAEKRNPNCSCCNSSRYLCQHN